MIRYLLFSITSLSKVYVQHVGCFHILAIVTKAAINVGMQMSFQCLLSFPSSEYLEVEWLDHIVVLFLIFFFLQTIQFSTVATPVCLHSHQ